MHSLDTLSLDAFGRHGEACGYIVVTDPRFYRGTACDLSCRHRASQTAMAKLNTRTKLSVTTHEGGRADLVSTYDELRRTVLTCLLWEDTFYEKGLDIAARIKGLVERTDPAQVAELAVEARGRMQLRHAPLLLVRELARRQGCGRLVADTLETVIQRADELAEFLALYWKDGRRPLSAGVKRGLARAFRRFDAYQLAKYNRDAKVKLRDVLFLCHAKPKDAEQEALWKKLVDGTLEAPDTWEVALSAGADKKETWERLLREGRLGGLAVLRNLRNMREVEVSDDLIRSRLDQGIARALPFRFVTAARYAPALEDDIETAMLGAVENLEPFPGSTGLLVDVSGSMDDPLSGKSEATRLDAACGLAILLREKAQELHVATFSERMRDVPPFRGFVLREAIQESQVHRGTYLRRALTALRGEWARLDRVIVITDEQSHDGIAGAFVKHAYIINVAPNQCGIGYRGGWMHIDGWSERVLDYIREIESLPAVSGETGEAADVPVESRGSIPADEPAPPEILVAKPEAPRGTLRSLLRRWFEV